MRAGLGGNCSAERLRPTLRSSGRAASRVVTQMSSGHAAELHVRPLKIIVRHVIRIFYLVAGNFLHSPDCHNGQFQTVEEAKAKDREERK